MNNIPESITVPHGIFYRLQPGAIAGIWSTDSGRLITAEHLVTTMDDRGQSVAQEVFTYHPVHGGPYLYCRTLEEKS